METAITNCVHVQGGSILYIFTFLQIRQQVAQKNLTQLDTNYKHDFQINLVLTWEGWRSTLLSFLFFLNNRGL